MTGPDTFDGVRDEIDDLRYDSGLGHEDVITELDARANALQPGSVGRTEYWSAAAEACTVADEHERAVRYLEQGVADGGETIINTKAALIGALIEAGHHDRVDDLLAELLGDVRAGKATGIVHEYVAEELEHAGRLKEALRWFGMSVKHLDDPDVVAVVELRNALRPARKDEVGRSRGQVILYWAAEERQGLLERWPDLDDLDDSLDEHRSRIEQALRTHQGNGTQPRLVSGTLDRFLEFAADTGLDPAESQTRKADANGLLSSGADVSWPPGRNSPCWCGSGAKYKRCCGGLTFHPPKAATTRIRLLPPNEIRHLARHLLEELCETKSRGPALIGWGRIGLGVDRDVADSPVYRMTLAAEDDGPPMVLAETSTRTVAGTVSASAMAPSPDGRGTLLRVWRRPGRCSGGGAAIAPAGKWRSAGRCILAQWCSRVR